MNVGVMRTKSEIYRINVIALPSSAVQTPLPIAHDAIDQRVHEGITVLLRDR